MADVYWLPPTDRLLPAPYWAHCCTPRIARPLLPATTARSCPRTVDRLLLAVGRLLLASYC